jgi:MFS transporter, DHA1 family, multidrug resistance protein
VNDSHKAGPMTSDTPFQLKIFVTLFFSLFATITGVGIVVPLLPVYAHELGAGGLAIGLVFGGFSFSRTALLPVFGRLSDRRGRKPLIVIGLLAYTLVSFAFIYSNTVVQLITIRFFQGMASAMIMPVVQAYVGDITPPGKEGLIMGMFNMSMFFGLSLGPVAGGLLNDHFSMQATFICMGALSFLGFALSLSLLPPTRSEAALARNRNKPPAQWRTIVRDRVVAGIFIYRFCYTAAIGIIWGFLPVMADAEMGLSSSRIGVLVMLGVFVSGLIQVPMGYLSDRFSRRAMVVAGGVLAGLAVILYMWAHSFAELFAAGVLFGLGGGTAMPALMAVAVKKGNHIDSMGSVMALLTMGHSLGMLIGALLAGLMMDWFYLRGAFGLGGAIVLLGVATFYFCTAGSRLDTD